MRLPIHRERFRIGWGVLEREQAPRTPNAGAAFCAPGPGDRALRAANLCSRQQPRLQNVRVAPQPRTLFLHGFLGPAKSWDMAIRSPKGWLMGKEGPGVPFHGLKAMPFGNATELLSRADTMKTAQEALRACLGRQRRHSYPGRQRRHSYQPRATPWVYRPKTILSAESATHCLAGLRPGPDAASAFELIGPKESYEAGRWPESNGYHQFPSISEAGDAGKDQR